MMKFLKSCSLRCVESSRGNHIESDVRTFVIDASASSWIQAFSICLHESAPFPSDSWLCLVLRTVHRLLSISVLQQGSSALHWYTTVYGESGVMGAHCTFLWWEFSFRRLALAAHDLNLGFSSSVRSHHRGPCGIASLKANKHLSTSKQVPHAFNQNIHASLVAPCSQRRGGRCNNGSF